MPESVDASSIRARLANGELVITIPKVSKVRAAQPSLEHSRLSMHAVQCGYGGRMSGSSLLLFCCSPLHRLCLQRQ